MATTYLQSVLLVQIQYMQCFRLTVVAITILIAAIMIGVIHLNTFKYDVITFGFVNFKQTILSPIDHQFIIILTLAKFAVKSLPAVASHKRTLSYIFLAIKPSSQTI